ncbi:hypothetical protein OPT61_g2585 [Boeremia exigua]|uniref:Uncharacterized protein n=1 Tax=Boeremia exigua TaxID=749465 RepID=A0ACC2IL03_9PLEO|nr:hypothetical protein OPT61_g2585 [Boeremia exigua]
MGCRPGWFALIVNNVSKDDLNQVADSGYMWKKLSHQLVHLNGQKPSEIAVLSWRWDTDEGSHPSRNLWNALCLAKELGFRYLFVDVISVDQSLTGTDLLNEVFAFTELYKTIPVIVAYDRYDTDILLTMRRPWITNEILALRENPTRVIYAGHNDQGVVHGPAPFHPNWVDILPHKLRGTAFAYMVNRIWRSGLCPSIIQLLTGENSMHTISDLKFLMPEHSEMLSTACDTMSRNDYLLTAAILGQVGWDRTPLEDTPESGFGWHFFQNQVFERYTVVEVVCTEKWTLLDFVLNGVRVARWDHMHNRYHMVENYRLHVEEDAERVLYGALMPPKFDFEDWVLRQRTVLDRRNAMLGVSGRVPSFELFSTSDTQIQGQAFTLINSSDGYERNPGPLQLITRDGHGNFETKDFDDKGNQGHDLIIRSRYCNGKYCG